MNRDKLACAEASAAERGAVIAVKAHLSLNVRSVERSIEFYRKLPGIGPSKVRSGYAKFDLQNPPLNADQVTFDCNTRTFDPPR